MRIQHKPNLPTGTVTFLFTDLEGSTRLWENTADQARTALLRHDRIIEEMVDARGYTREAAW